MNRISRFTALVGMVVCVLCAFAASASARGPAVTTGSATGVKEMQATLNGTVTSYAPGSYSFEYGPTTSYGYKAYGGTVAESIEPIPVSKLVTSLATATTYHYRIVGTNKDGTTFGSDKTFTTTTPDAATALAGMATTEPFDGSATSLANFSANWATLGWAGAKGEDTAIGWRASGEYPSVSGAYLNQTLTDAGQGLGVSATMAAAPGSEGRYFSLWLDMSNPSGASRAGYELRLTTEAGGNYQAKLVYWIGGSPSTLATQSSIALAAGNSVALSDYGSSVKAWTNTGSGFKQLLSVVHSGFSGGKAGVEASGNVARLTKFKAGALLTPVANINDALLGLSPRDSFAVVQSPLSGEGAWAAPTWASGTGQVYSTGWGSTNPAPAVNGAYWQKAAFADTGAGTGVSVSREVAPGSSQSFSLWLDMPSPGSAKTGYEARFIEYGTDPYYETMIYKWQAGVKTTLSTVWTIVPTSTRVAFVDKGSSLSIYTMSENVYYSAFSAADSAFNSGFAGVESSSNVVRLRDFRAGPLAPF
jgi:hypothetical protein